MRVLYALVGVLIRPGSSINQSYGSAVIDAELALQAGRWLTFACGHADGGCNPQVDGHDLGRSDVMLVAQGDHAVQDGMLDDATGVGFEGGLTQLPTPAQIR